jgi:hypothetical protein
MAEPIFMKLGMCIMTAEPVLPISLCLDAYPLIIAMQRLGKKFTIFFW